MKTEYLRQTRDAENLAYGRERVGRQRDIIRILKEVNKRNVADINYREWAKEYDYLLVDVQWNFIVDCWGVKSGIGEKISPLEALISITIESKERT
jgi:hypothetical protein